MPELSQKRVLERARNMSCSCWGLYFGSQDPCRVAHNCLQYQLQGSTPLQWARTLRCTHSYTDTPAKTSLKLELNIY